MTCLEMYVSAEVTVLTPTCTWNKLWLQNFHLFPEVTSVCLLGSGAACFLRNLLHPSDFEHSSLGPQLPLGAAVRPKVKGQGIVLMRHTG